VAVEIEDLLAAGVDIIAPECAVPPQVPDANLRAVVKAARGDFEPDPAVTDATNMADGYRAQVAAQSGALPS
jgi:putative N-acetylmannosamine-6-phosphate epimerase